MAPNIGASIRQLKAAVAEWIRSTRRIAIVALARKLLIALWKHARTGLLPEGVELQA
jgi:hypothetical protein